jgi:phenylalanyl-tRNA synthetase beta chain
LRLFEVGSRHGVSDIDGDTTETRCVAGIVIGSHLPEQWGEKATPVDVFDVKADVEALLTLGAGTAFEAGAHPALHPGRCARLVLGGQSVGWLGEIHPRLAAQFDLPGCILFDIDATAVSGRTPPSYRMISRYPSVRRDLAVVVARSVPAGRLLDAVRGAIPGILLDAFVFDIYTGSPVAATEKSVAIGLILQDTSRTLTDEDADAALHAARATLDREFKARIRE